LTAEESAAIARQTAVVSSFLVIGSRRPGLKEPVLRCGSHDPAHLTSILHRIGVSDRVQAALWATHEIA
jgi:hypothetical protein